MKNIYDIQQLLKSFDIIIYMKDYRHRLQLMEYEIRELKRLELINQNDFIRAIAIIKNEISKL